MDEILKALVIGTILAIFCVVIFGLLAVVLALPILLGIIFNWWFLLLYFIISPIFYFLAQELD